jgi:hypothetical protein
MISYEEPTSMTLDLQAAGGHLGFQAALEQLSRAAAYALDAERSPWDFAVELESLTKVGLTTSDLRWLVSKGYLEHAYEITGNKDARRRFQPCRHLAFGQRTCFVLTTQGSRLAAPRALGLATTEADGPPLDMPSTTVDAAIAVCLPSWDNQRRILRVGRRVVKKYRVPSLCQEAILSAFEEEGWPAAIDDPLPPHPDQEPKRRLRDTIKSLNANQVNSLLSFRGDGSGSRVLWELKEDAEAVPVLQVRGGIRAA